MFRYTQANSVIKITNPQPKRTVQDRNDSYRYFNINILYLIVKTFYTPPP